MDLFPPCLVVHVGDQLPRLFDEHIDHLLLVQVLQERILIRVALELLNQPFVDFIFASCVLLLDCRKGYDGYSVVNVVATNCPGALRSAWCSFRLVLVDPVDHCANSLWPQHVAIFGVRIPCGIFPSSSSCLPLSQCKPQAVCCGRRLPVTVFDKLTILSSERYLQIAPIYRILMMFPKYFCMERSLDCSWNLLHTVVIVHRVHKSEEPTSDYGIHFTCIPDVVDVLSKSFG